MNPLLLIDLYKADHRSQYPANTELVYSNFTPRQSRVEGNNDLVFFGLQALMQRFFVDDMDQHFFGQPKSRVLRQYESYMKAAMPPGFKVDVQHVSDLHDLGYLPLYIKALPEGSVVPMQTPVLTIRNTHPKFFWLTNYFESLISNELWKPCTSATSAWLFRKRFDYFANLTGGDPSFVQWQGHDFAFRGMSGIGDAKSSGAGHLTSFTGTDTLPAIPWVEQYYYGDSIIGGSVPATEHSVMSCDDEYAVFDRLITEVYPEGVVSIVSDTYDFWQIVGDYLPSRKPIIMARNGKVVIRPDTGKPNLILCGDPNSKHEIEKKGLIRSLRETFGGTITEKGYMQLDSHVGAIYGDSINLTEQELILTRLANNEFASTNVVLGIGSYTYQYVTRDTYGFACKATYRITDGESRNIFKNPKTGSWKKSHKGLLYVGRDDNGNIIVEEEVDWAREEQGLLRPVFVDGEMVNKEAFGTIRNRLHPSWRY